MAPGCQVGPLMQLLRLAPAGGSDHHHSEVIVIKGILQFTAIYHHYHYDCYQSDNELIFPIDIDSDLMVSNQMS